MYLAVILVCGLAPTTPMATEGCLPASSTKVYSTEEECWDFVRDTMEPYLQPQLPEGSFFADRLCVFTGPTT